MRQSESPRARGSERGGRREGRPRTSLRAGVRRLQPPLEPRRGSRVVGSRGGALVCTHSRLRRSLVETEWSICSRLKSRSAFISLSFSSVMSDEVSCIESLREIDCSSLTTSCCAFSIFLSSVDFVASKVSMSSDISLSRW